MMSRFRIQLMVVAMVLVTATPSAAQGPAGRDEPSRNFSIALEEVEGEIDTVIRSAEAWGGILTRVTKIVQSLNVPAPDQKLLNEAIYGFREIEGIANEIGTSHELRLNLGLATDRLRTEALNPSSMDMPKLMDDLHHSIGYAALGENRRAVAAMNDLLSPVLDTSRSLDSLVGQLKGRPGDSRGRFSIPLIRNIERPDLLFHRFDDLHQSITSLSERVRAHREVAALIRAAMKDLESFQNAIGLQNAHEKLEEARGKFNRPGLDDELRIAVELGLDRVNAALLSPSSTDMELLREELHHAMIHRAENVLLHDAIEAHRISGVILGMNARAIAAAGKLEEALTAALAREIPAMRLNTGLEPRARR